MIDPLASRVARRFLALESPKEMLKLLEGARARITPLLRDESRVEELKQVYLTMAEKVRPLASALEGVYLQRPDEARKLKNLQAWLRTVDRRTRPDLFDNAEDAREVQIAVHMYLEDLESALKSIIRSGPRIEGYTQIEKTIRHGPFTLVNSFGFRPEEYSEPLRLFDAATEAVNKAGFGAALYGDVRLVAPDGGGWAGRYRPDTDDAFRAAWTDHHNPVQRAGADYALNTCSALGQAASLLTKAQAEVTAAIKTLG
jgi:hypothetical protein